MNSRLQPKSPGAETIMLLPSVEFGRGCWRQCGNPLLLAWQVARLSAVGAHVSSGSRWPPLLQDISPLSAGEHSYGCYSLPACCLAGGCTGFGADGGSHAVVSWPRAHPATAAEVGGAVAEESASVKALSGLRSTPAPRSLTQRRCC